MRTPPRWRVSFRCLLPHRGWRPLRVRGFDRYGEFWCYQFRQLVQLRLYK